jgi:tetratricopeptide (TPR) repeat protein
LHIGNCYFLNDQWAKAEFFYRLSLENSKTNQEKALAFNNLAMIEFKFEQWEKGREFLRQSITAAGNFKVPHFNLSQVYIQFGLFDKAIDILSGPMFKDSKDVDVYFSLANAYLFKGDLSRSGSYFNLLPQEHFKREDIAASYALYLLKQNKIHAAKTIMDDRDRSHVIMVTEISQRIEKLIGLRLKEE